MHCLLSSSRFLRVLDLHGISVKSLPEAVGHLIHLRYITLNTVEQVPRSLEKLSSQQTLQITYLEGSLPSGFSKTQSLRCLSVSHTSLKVPNKMGDLMSLQKLKGVWADSKFIRYLVNLTQFQTLVIRIEKSEDGRALCRSIQRMLHSFPYTYSPLVIVALSKK
ncbi:hypothetical protein AMTRI_Chr02g257970 [Amborella trichopoda]